MSVFLRTSDDEGVAFSRIKGKRMLLNFLIYQQYIYQTTCTYIEYVVLHYLNNKSLVITHYEIANLIVIPVAIISDIIICSDMFPYIRYYLWAIFSFNLR